MTARRPRHDDEERLPRPTVIALMAEHGPFLWNRSPRLDGLRHDYEVDPERLGVSPELITAMTAWNDRFQLLALTPDFSWASSAEERAWQRQGLDLAYRLQHELGPDVDVLYPQDGDERPIAERRGR